MFNDLLLIIVGPTNIGTENCLYFEQMKNYIDRLGLNDKVIFTGNVKNVNEWLQISDVFLFASKKEGFPSVIIQAMATGIPIISLPLLNIIDFIITDQVTGIISEDIDGAAHKIVELFTDRKKYIRISNASVKTALENFSERKIMGLYSALYNSL